MNYFDRSTEAARELAKNLRSFQSARRPWERAINQSPLIVAAAALAGPALGGVLYWLFG